MDNSMKITKCAILLQYFLSAHTDEQGLNNLLTSLLLATEFFSDAQSTSKCFSINIWLRYRTIMINVSQTLMFGNLR